MAGCNLKTDTRVKLAGFGVAFVVGVVAVIIASLLEPTTVLPPEATRPTDKMIERFHLQQIQALQNPISSLINWDIALFAIVGFSIRNGFGVSNKIILCKFILFLLFISVNSSSLYFGYKLQIGIVEQLNNALFNTLPLNELL